MAWIYGAYYWTKLMEIIGNEYGVAGLMGNFVVESNLIPYRLQNDFTEGYTTSLQYTSNVQAGVISEYKFVHDSKGYSVAQWTYFSRKQTYYNGFKGGEGDIGSPELSIYTIKTELEGDYKGVLTYLQNATSLDDASDYVLYNYEAPKYPEATKQDRRDYALEIYNEYTGTTPEPTPPSPTSDRTKMPLWLYPAVRLH